MKSHLLCFCACIFTCIPAIVFSQTSLRSFATADEILCHGGYTTVHVSATGGVAPYTGTGDFIVQSGEYAYTVSDANHNTSSVVINIANPDALVAATNTVDMVSAAGAANINVSADGGTAPYTGTGNFTAQPGIHTYTIADAKGCPAVQTVNLAEQINATDITASTTEDTIATALKASATNGTILCNGGTTTVVVTATGGVEPYTGTGTFTVSAGAHDYTVQDAAGNICHVAVILSEPEPLVITVANNVDMSSCWQEKVNVSVTTTGGTMPYHYNLNAGQYQELNTFSNLNEGTYNIIVKDNNGCIALTPAVITKPVPFKAWFDEVADVSSCGFIDGFLKVTQQGGIAPFQYKLNSGDFQDSNLFDTLPSFDYAVIVKDSRGCETSAYTTIKKDKELQLSVNSITPVSSCSNNDGAIRVNASGGSGGYTFCINGEGYQDSNEFSMLKEKEYTITVKDRRGCTKTLTTNVTKIPVLVANTQHVVNTGSCANDGAFEIGFSGGTAPYSYSVNGSAFQADNVYNNLSAGIYNVQIKEGRGCVAAAIATISKMPGLNVNATVTPVTCKNGSDGTITISNSGGTAPYSYSLNGESFDAKNVFTNLSAGKYTVVIRDNKNCMATTQVKIEDGFGTCVAGTRVNFSADAAGTLKVLVLPNPSPDAFTLLTSTNSTDKTEVIVTDISGKIVYRATGVANQQFTFGNNFTAGMYAARIIQGWQVKYVKLLKTQNR